MSTLNQLVVSNWDIFFMNRLNRLASNDEFCDYTIRSELYGSFKVHRVVLNACSDYFVSRPSTENTMTMPVHLDFDAVKSVIMFMYTGQLYFSEGSLTSLVEVCDMLQMTVLHEILELQNREVNKVIPKYHSPQSSTSRNDPSIALNQCEPAKKQTIQTNMTVRSPPKHTLDSTFNNTMKMKDILSENKPMQLKCDIDDVPEFIEQTFESPRYDSAPLIKQENCNSVNAILKSASNEELIESKDKDHRTQVIKRKVQTTLLSLAGKKFKIVHDPNPDNIRSKIVLKILKNFPHLLQNTGNIKLKIMSTTNQTKFECMILNTPNSVKKILPAGSGVKKPITIHKVNPDIMNVTGPWFCNLCGTDTNPLKLDSYLTYRRHRVEKHNEKEDTRVCEHCGYFSALKRLQIHHMYSKHKIQPPAGLIQILST